MIEGVFFHTLKGINGLSYLNISCIDISKIKSMTYRRRLFCIFEKDYPFTLEIIYKEPKTEIRINPVLAGNNVGAGLHQYTSFTQIITKRYKCENDVFDEIKEIKRKEELMKNKINELFKIIE